MEAPGGSAPAHLQPPWDTPQGAQRLIIVDVRGAQRRHHRGPGVPTCGKRPGGPHRGSALPTRPIPNPPRALPTGHWEGADGRGPASLSESGTWLACLLHKQMFFSCLGSCYNKQPHPPMIKRHVVGGLRHLLVDKDPFCPIKISLWSLSSGMCFPSDSWPGSPRCSVRTRRA